MNKKRERKEDAYRSFLLMSEIEKEEPLSQRELSQRLGVAVGLVNSYLKNLVAKGFVRVKAFPRNRYAYLLTPKGIAEKSRLAYRHLNYFTSLYTVTRQDYHTLFTSFQEEGVEGVAFCGVDEVAEIAFLSLQETGLSLLLVMDEEKGDQEFFSRPVVSLTEGVKSVSASIPIIITSLKRKDSLHNKVESMGVKSSQIFMIG